MAKANTIVKREVTLFLTEDEADFLKALTQNFLGPVGTEEPVDEHELRNGIFKVLNNALEQDYR